MLLTVLLQVAVGAAIGKTAAVLSAALVVIGAAFGLSKIGKSAMESIARQPEASGELRTAMILVAAMVEGAALFAIIVCLLAILIN
ncbi:MAG: ATP synthase F0 subunit C [Candidatus Cryptobacteroides sp.]|jgi:ATP synthase, F0 subunit c